MALETKRLKPGNLIGLIAPASAPQTLAKVENSRAYFERLGYNVVVGKNVMHAHGYLAASDKERLSDLHAMFKDRRVKAIFFLRGGYGTIRLLPHIDYEMIRQHP